MKVPAYTEKTDHWWDSNEAKFDVWIEEKYKYCLHHCMKAIRDSEEDEEAFLFPVFTNIFIEKNNFTDATRLREIKAKDLYNAFQKYCKLVSEINSCGAFFLPSKQTFCSFVNIPVQVFNQMAIGSDENASVVETINDYFVSNLAYAGQSGAAKSSTLNLMLKAEDAGQGIMTAKESKTASSVNINRSLEDISKRFKEIAD